MGWSSGEGLFKDVWDIVKSHVHETVREQVCEELVDVFEQQDADTLFDDCDGLPELEAIKKRRYPDEEE